MIITRLTGGLGNQMFQYAAGRRIAHVNNSVLKLDTSFFNTKQKGITPRTFKLAPFNIKAQIATNKEVKYFKKYKKSANRLFGFLYNKLIADDSIYIQEKGFGFNPRILDLKDNVYLDGYWQSEKYFSDIKNIIREDFMSKEELSNTNKKISEMISSINSISIHIRRGDYASSERLQVIYGLCPLNYYYTAINSISKAVKNPHFFVFSDDIGWAKQNLKITHPVKFIIGNKALVDLCLMSQCKHHIIANSSFSWWGAWLSTNKNKIVYAPKQWFKKTKLIPHDLIPESWIRI